MSTTLITGCAGFIGSHLTDRLLAAGERIVGIDSFVDTYDPAAKRRNLAAASSNQRFTLIESDIRDADAIDRVVGEHRPQTIVHLAALAGVRPSIDAPALYCDVNITGTARLLDAAVRHRVPGFVFGSSSSVYGNNRKVPFAEADPVDFPISPYAATKRAGELLAHAYHHLHGMSIACLRFFTVFGPRQRPDLAIMKFMRLIRDGKPIPVFGDGGTSRDYTYVGDIVEGIVSASNLVNQRLGFDVLNLGSRRPITLADLIAEIEAVTARRALVDRRPMQAGDVERTFADLTLSERILDYRPSTTLRDGLAAQWAWLCSHS